MKFINISLAVISFCVFGLASGCKKKSPTTTNEPSVLGLMVITDSVINFSSTIVSSGGQISNESDIMDKGLLWGTDSNSLTISNTDKVSNGTGTENFVDTIRNLKPNTVYYIKAYAVFPSGTRYGSSIKFTTLPVVYITGSTGSFPMYWRNGIPVHLGLVSSFVSGGSSSIYAVGTDVYATGNIETTLPATYVPYWKNGTEFVLTDTNAAASPSTFTTGAGNAICVRGNDIYIAGYELQNGVNPVAKYWKNGIAVALTTGGGTNNSLANSIYVVGSDVYVAGYVRNAYLGTVVATYWKNGVAVSLNDGTKSVGVAYSIFVDSNNNDVYVAGNETPGVGSGAGLATQAAKYWKNGNPIALTDGTQDAGAYSVFVSNNEVYVAGFESDSLTGFGIAKYWKNGTAYPLTDDSFDGDANSIYVLNGNVYISGFTVPSRSNGYQNPKCWINGSPVPLMFEKDAVANSIFVQ